jgi:DNA-binding transcriptional regulator YhcF (GntR family)
MSRRPLPEALPGSLAFAVDRTSPTPLYRQIYQAFRDAITDRRLRAGARLPSTRSLAEEIGVSRLPVVEAFEQLLAEGYFEARVGVGTFVADVVPAPSAARHPAVMVAEIHGAMVDRRCGDGNDQSRSDAHDHRQTDAVAPFRLADSCETRVERLFRSAGVLLEIPRSYEGRTHDPSARADTALRRLSRRGPRLVRSG